MLLLCLLGDGVDQTASRVERNTRFTRVVDCVVPPIDRANGADVVAAASFLSTRWRVKVASHSASAAVMMTSHTSSLTRTLPRC